MVCYQCMEGAKFKKLQVCFNGVTLQEMAFREFMFEAYFEFENV